MNKRKCKNCAYALAFFDADELDKKSKTLCACQHGHTDGKADIVPVDNVCDAHLFAGEEREGRRA